MSLKTTNTLSLIRYNLVVLSIFTSNNNTLGRITEEVVDVLREYSVIKVEVKNLNYMNDAQVGISLNYS